MPLIRRILCSEFTVEMSPRAKEYLKNLSGAAILAPNHPTHDDPVVMFEISKQVGKNFNYVAAYEVFEEKGKFEAWMMQCCGVYSVVRGSVDRESFRMTRQLLAEKQRQVVIFIEGTAPFQNDSLLPFQAGVVQFGFWAIEDAIKAGKPLTALPVVPIFIKYVFRSDPMPKLLTLLEKLERKVLGSQKHGSILERIRVLGEGVLTTLEKGIGIEKPADAQLGERVENMKKTLLERAENIQGIVPRPNQPYSERVFALRRKSDDEPFGDGEHLTPYSMRLFEERRQRLAFLHRDIERLTLFANFYDGYLREYPSPERIGDILERLHREVEAGRRAALPPRIAKVEIGTPIDLVARQEAYKESRKQVVADITASLESEMRALLETQFKTLTRPIADAQSGPA